MTQGLGREEWPATWSLLSDATPENPDEAPVAHAETLPTRRSIREASGHRRRRKGRNLAARGFDRVLTRRWRNSSTASTTRQRVLARILPGFSMLSVASLALALTLPAYAGAPTLDQSRESTFSSAGAEQSLEVPSTAVGGSVSERDGWTALSYAQVLAEQYGNRDFTYRVSNGAIRWPFPYQTTISDGYGYRIAPCNGCSTFHQGVDFTPGAGAAIFAIADGVVVEREESNWSYGNYVVIRHEVGGLQVDSLYAHMQHGTCPLVIGSTVSVGDFVGLVGDTGSSTGAHLHLEIRVEGVKIDPFAWLTAHAT